MFNLFLTQGSGFLGPIEKLLGWILNLIYEFLNIFGIENVGLSIIFFTMIVKTLMLPLTIRQQKFSKLSSVMNPEITEVQNKYKGKKDEASAQKMQTEMQAIYSKYGTSPTSGCLPMLVTLPIMMGLYRVIYKIPAYIKPIKELYTVVAETIKGIDGYAAILVDYAKELSVNVSDFSEFSSDGILTLNHAIDILSKFKAETWESLATVFPSVSNTIETYSSEIIRVNSIPGGLNLLENPGFAWPGIIIPILAASLQFIQTKQISNPNANDSDNPGASSMNMMTKFMPIMSGVFCTMLPTGVGLYWVSNSLFTIIQQFFINKYMQNADIDEMIEKNKEKQKEKSKPIGVNQGNSFENIAKKSTKSIDIDKDNIYISENMNSKSSKQDDTENNISNNNSNKSGSISDYANILNKDRNDN